MFDDHVHLSLDEFLAKGERVELGLGNDEGLVAVMGGDEVADYGDTEGGIIASSGGRFFGVAFQPALKSINHSEIFIHVLVFDECPAKDELGDEDEGNEVCGRFAITSEGGDN